MSLLSGFRAANTDKKRQRILDSLIHYEARLGGQLFGKLPEGRDRQFFCLDEHTWVWHEAWTDKAGQQHSTTTRYIVRPDKTVVKTTGNGQYSHLNEAEAKHLYQAVKLYQQKVHAAYSQMLNPAR